jgi:hypothetical protein
MWTQFANERPVETMLSVDFNRAFGFVCPKLTYSAYSLAQLSVDEFITITVINMVIEL